jgi:NADH-ubiquinone oxidoreductase chain 2
LRPNYLNIVKQIFFDKPEYKINPEIANINLHGSIIKKNLLIKKLTFKLNNIVLSSSLTITISILTLIIVLFIFTPQEWLSMANILALILFNA